MSYLLESVGQILDWTELTSDTIHELEAILLFLVMSALKYTVIILNDLKKNVMLTKKADLSFDILSIQTKKCKNIIL